MSEAEILRVLLIDDDELDRAAVRRELRWCDHPHIELTEAADGDAALKLLETGQFDCALLDYRLPDVDGLDILRRARERGIRTPIIMLTGHGNEQVAVDIMKAGAADYLSKSRGAMEHLCQSIRSAVRVSRAEQRAASDRAERQRALHERAEMASLLDTLLASAPIGFAFLDCDLRFVRVNASLAQMTGGCVEAMLGRRFDELLPELWKGCAQAFARVQQTGEPSVGVECHTSAPQVHASQDQGQNQPHSGSSAARVAQAQVTDDSRDYLLSIYPVRGGDGKVFGIGCVVQDVTQSKRIERELKQARDAAEAASRAKDLFLATLSHELRTPLTPVLTMLESLCAQPLDDAVRDSVEMIRRNVELEARLIDDLLDLTSIAKGKLRIHPTTVDVHALLNSALDICRPDIQARSLRLSVELRAQRHHVRADAARLQQVFWNLIKNAAKYSRPGGSIIIRTGNTRLGPDEYQVFVEVIDDGIGIEPDALGRIFNAFEQGGSRPNTGGLGLGLTISKSLVELHGGTLTADSPGAGRGATFTVTLKTAAAPAERSAIRQDQPSEPAPSHAPGTAAAVNRAQHRARPRILMVDDHPDTNLAMQRLLSSLGYDVRTAHSVASALQAADREHFDVLISDIGLPDGSGLDLMRQLLARKGSKPIKGIALSGFGMEEDIRKSLAAGFQEHLTKPVNLQRLQHLISELVT
ncbi:response regulator [Fontivita pretiosa]|uniref:hybrid sensor histidine kinase/response regulator n=1 Tax=Fontivita pretiosa TaxID=2989684 RepID=UPI003D172C59